MSDKIDNKEQFPDFNSLMVNKLVNGGIDKVTAYQKVYKISYEQALELVLKQRYEALVSTGLSKEEAEKLVYKNEESNLKKK